MISGATNLAPSASQYAEDKQMKTNRRIIRGFTQFEINAIKAYGILHDSGVDMADFPKYTLVLERQGRMTIAVVLDVTKSPSGEYPDFVGAGVSLRNASDKEDPEKGELLAIMRAIFDPENETFPV